jgi:hypothetical protein
MSSIFNASAAVKTDRGTRNYAIFAALMTCLVAIHFVIEANPGATRNAAQSAVFSWTALSIIGALGSIAVFCLNRTALRGLWDPEVALRAKLGLPFAVGALVGALSTLVDQATGFTEAYAREMNVPSMHIDFPLSVPIYLGGGILVTIIYYLILIPPVVWLVSSRLLQGRHAERVFWAVALPLTLVEPLTQGNFALLATKGWIALPGVIVSVTMNLGQAWLLLRAGLVAAIALRLGYYAVWHIVYPLL